MSNPILKMLATSVMQRNPDLANSMNLIKQFCGNKKDASATFNQLMQSNPQFRQFINQNSGKSLEEISKAYGLDIELVKEVINMV